jgi:hypothetical protein
VSCLILGQKSARGTHLVCGSREHEEEFVERKWRNEKSERKL